MATIEHRLTSARMDWLHMPTDQPVAGWIDPFFSGSGKSAMRR